MPRPMTRYRSGIVTVTRSFWQTCPTDGCGQLSHRSRRFEAVDAQQQADAWSPDPRCFVHLRAARRAEVGL
jgi:hypothetical protein